MAIIFSIQLLCYDSNTQLIADEHEYVGIYLQKVLPV